MNIYDILRQIKTDFDRAILSAQFNGKSYENGNKAKTSLIRSQRIINYIHEFVKNEFKRCGVPPQMIFPPIGISKPEIKIKGLLKSKNQDVVIIPLERLIPLTNTVLPELEQILSVNVRSQLSSLRKNIDTLYERTFAEALNLHLSFPNQCLGEVYLIPTHEYDDKAMVRNRVDFKAVSKIEDYIRMFQAINNRRVTNKEEYKYERICLLIADFKQETPKLYNSIEELKNHGLVPQNSTVSLENLTADNFAEDLLAIYTERFGQDIIA